MAWAHVTEFQKRGLPHEHFLLIMGKSSKLSSPNDFDKYIFAELPNKKNILSSINLSATIYDAWTMWNSQCKVSVRGGWQMSF